MSVKWTVKNKRPHSLLQAAANTEVRGLTFTKPGPAFPLSNVVPIPPAKFDSDDQTVSIKPGAKPQTA